MHTRFWHGDIQSIAQFPRQCVYKGIAAFSVEQGHSPHVPREILLDQKIGQRHLFQQREMYSDVAMRRDQALEQLRRSDQVPRRKEGKSRSIVPFASSTFSCLSKWRQ